MIGEEVWPSDVQRLRVISVVPADFVLCFGRACFQPCEPFLNRVMWTVSVHVLLDLLPKRLIHLRRALLVLHVEGNKKNLRDVFHVACSMSASEPDDTQQSLLNGNQRG